MRSRGAQCRQWRGGAPGQFGASPFKAVVQFVEVCLRLGDIAFEAGNVLALDAAVRQLCKRHVGAMDQLAERDLEVLSDGLDLSRTFDCDLFEERIERLFYKGLLYAGAVG